MTAYYIRRLLLTIPTFIGITVVVFILTRLVPGGPIEQAIVQMQQANTRSNSSNQSQTPLSDEQMQQLREYYGFDKPILVSYSLWIRKVLSFDLGQSTRYNEPVWDIIKARLPVSAFYGLVTMLLTYLICIPLGILKAVKHSTAIDSLTSIAIFVGHALPSYVVGIILLVLCASRWGIAPMGGFASENFATLSTGDQIVDIFKHAILPLTTYMAGSFAYMTLLMKNNLMDHLAADYVRTAMAKGARFRRAVFGHALQNSLVPIATSFGNNISALIAGSFLVERIFNIEGFGLLGYQAVVERDYPLVMGILVLSAGLLLIGNILSDLCVSIVDPRVTFD